VKRISAPEIESAVIRALRSRSASDADDRALVEEHLSRAVLSSDIELQLTDGDAIRIDSPKRSSGRGIMGLADASALPMKAEARAVLLRCIALGRQCVAELERGRSVDLDQLAEQNGCTLLSKCGGGRRLPGLLGRRTEVRDSQRCAPGS